MENKNEMADISKRKALSIIGFLVSITLLVGNIFINKSRS